MVSYSTLSLDLACFSYTSMFWVHPCCRVYTLVLFYGGIIACCMAIPCFNFLSTLLFYFCMYVCTSVYVWEGVPVETKMGIRGPGVGVTGSYEPFDVGARPLEKQETL